MGKVKPKRYSVSSYIPYVVGGAARMAYKLGKKVLKTKRMTKTKKKSMKRRRGARGVYRGRVKGAYKQKSGNKFARYGLEYKTEFNSVVSDKSCVYVGHGVAAEKAYGAVIGAAMRALLVKVGIDITHWDDSGMRLGSKEGRIAVQYSHPDGAVEDDFDVIYGTNSYRGILNALIAEFKTIQQAFLDKPVVFKRMIFYADSAQSLPSAVLNLEQFTVEFQTISKMKIQNRTLARKDTTEDGGDQDSSENIEANPVTGKVYEQTLWKNGFSIKGLWRLNTTALDVLNTNEEGIIQGLATLMDADSSGSTVRKPPAAYYMGEKVKARTVKLDPGVIKSHSFVFKCTMNFNVFLNKLQCATNGATQNLIQNFGKAAVIGLEKECSIGIANGDDTQVMNYSLL